MRIARRTPGVLGLLLIAPLLSQAQTTVVTERVRAELVAHAPDGLLPGRTVRLGLLITHQLHWHTYWRNSGDSGLPTTLAWELPSGVSAGPIEWPTPQRLPIGPLVNYGYEGTVLLPVTLAIPPGFASPTLDVRLRGDWLVCKEICIPEFGEFSVQLPLGAKISTHAQPFANAAERLPRTVSGVQGTAASKLKRSCCS